MDIKTVFNPTFLKSKFDLFVEKFQNSRAGKWLYGRFGTKTPWILGGAIVLLIVAGIFSYRNVHASASTSTKATMQTSVARRGDLVIYASGTGTLIAANQVDLAFKSSGQVKDINVKVSDQVQKGDLLAEEDDADAQIKYTQAKRSLLELTSPTSIANALQAIGTAQSEVDTTVNQLSYLIGPDVYYWENEVAKAQQDLKDAKDAADKSPNDKDLQQKVTDKENYLKYVQDKLTGSQYYYEHTYVPKTFTVFDRRTGTKTVAEPSEGEITEARAAVDAAKASLQEAQYLYTKLTGGEIPDDATGSGLTDLETAQLNVDSAKDALDGTKIYAPISGTIMSINTSVGDTVGTDAVISVADLSQYYLEIFLDETDWGNVAVGYEAQITFDALPEKTFTGKVTQVDPGLYTSGNTSVVRAIVQLDANQNINLPIGTSAAVDVIGGRANSAVLIPVEALHKAGDQYAVFVLQNGKPRLRIVEVGIQDLVSAEIKSGLQPGDIVTTGLSETK